MTSKGIHRYTDRGEVWTASAIFLSQEYLTLLKSSTILPATWSDHSPILTTIHSPLFKPNDKQWKLNKQILDELEAQTDTRTTLQRYFEENDLPDTDPLMVWAAYPRSIHPVLYPEEEGPTAAGNGTHPASGRTGKLPQRHALPKHV
ncbi:Hypothetical predicted protein [Pelobates cultripes]|uniref:Endonuclease/exonuclease/phosphatase domain-containing protein n=1 Tax=Pelobates cultripes TaxID=61616 RepID=A0AAD1VUD1_PELCU|nr:Hypothetical predicted protein [Pelobates cultripes]